MDRKENQTNSIVIQSDCMNKTRLIINDVEIKNVTKVSFIHDAEENKCGVNIQINDDSETS